MALPQGLFLPPRTTTLYVAAADASDRARAQADFLCIGVNDHLVIQAALDALPAAGGMVFLSEGTFNCEVQIDLDTNQTLRGCGRNTILTTSTADLIFLSAVGGAGTELTGIVIADLQIDGGAGAVSDCGIYFEYVDYSLIQNVYSRRHYSGMSSIYLANSDSNQIIANVIQGNDYGITLDASCRNIIIGNLIQGSHDEGIYIIASSDGNVISSNNCIENDVGILLDSSSDNTIEGNDCIENTLHGIFLTFSYSNTITGNTCNGNTRSGIEIADSNDNSIIANTCQENGRQGIKLDTSNHNSVIGNSCIANSQAATNTYDNIPVVDDSNYNNVQGNICRAGALAAVPRYGINITAADCDKNLVIGNDIYDDGFGTGALNDAGTLTHVEDDNRGIEITQIKMYRRVKNTSGSAMAIGDVVSLKAVAAGNEIIDPAAVGERQVYGMVAEIIADTEEGLVLVKGFTDVLKATNAGGGNIAIGDNLITENGVRARKAAAATDPIFARALEACAAANCTIDAYIKSPWD